MAEPTLHSLGGRSAPSGLADDLDLLARFSERAKDRLWAALGPCLSDPLPDTMNALLDDFCRTNGVAGEDLARAIKSCRFLVRQASMHDVAAAEFRADIALLCGEASEASDLLMRGYEAGKAQVRVEILRASLREHGKVLDGVDWRVDTMVASSRGLALSAPVCVLTLRYSEGDASERMTVHLPLEAVRELQAICGAVLAVTRPSSR